MKKFQSASQREWVSRVLTAHLMRATPCIPKEDHDGVVDVSWGPSRNGYHNYDHLCAVYDRLLLPGYNKFEGLALRYAALFHDYGYIPGEPEQENIERAVTALHTQMGKLWIPVDGIPEYLSLQGTCNSAAFIQDVTTRAEQLIRDTAYETSEDIHNAGALAVADLSFLFGSWGDYTEYMSAVRREHRVVPREKYLKGRLAVMTSMLSKLEEEGSWGGHLGFIRTEIQMLEEATSQRKGKALLYAGSFDPPHKGHYAVIREAVRQGYHVVVVPLKNSSKTPLLPVEVRTKLLTQDLQSMGLVDRVRVTSTSAPNDVTVVAVQEGCTGFLRGNRGFLDNEASRARILKTEGGIPTVIVKTATKYRDYSSSAAKELVKNHYPCKALTKATRQEVSKWVTGVDVHLLVGGICSGKSSMMEACEHVRDTLIKGDKPFTVDLDVVAKQALNSVGMGQSHHDILQKFSSAGSYKRYMAQVKPFILAGLRSHLMDLNRSTPGGADPVKVIVQVNTLGLLWGELVRMANGNIFMMPEVKYEEALARTEKRGSSGGTTREILRLEGQLCPTEGWEEWCTKRGYTMTMAGCNEICMPAFKRN